MTKRWITKRPVRSWLEQWKRVYFFKPQQKNLNLLFPTILQFILDICNYAKPRKSPIFNASHWQIKYAYCVTPGKNWIYHNANRDYPSTTHKTSLPTIRFNRLWICPLKNTPLKIESKEFRPIIFTCSKVHIDNRQVQQHTHTILRSSILSLYHAPSVNILF